MDQNMQTKIETLCKDEEYMKHLVSLGSAEAISKELEKQDIELSADELKNIYSLAKKKAEGELSDDELESVAGGSISVWIFAAIVGSIAGWMAGEFKDALNDPDCKK